MTEPVGGAPHSAADVHNDAPLPIEGFKGTPEEIERQWYEQVYKGRGDSMLQLSLRAVLMGSALGALLSLTNLYIGLKAGWAFGVAITACILSYALWTTFHRIRLARTPMTILENNCMQSTASSAGYSTGGTLVSAFAAYVMLTNEHLSTPLMLAWVFFLAVLGVTMAVPMKRQMINVEQLRFPTGIAAAETLRALHSHGDKGMRSARALGIAGFAAAASEFLTNGMGVLGAKIGGALGERVAGFSIGGLVERVNHAIFGTASMSRTVMFEWNPIFLAAGAISGVRVCTSMMIGGITCWMLFVPYWLGEGVISIKVDEPVPQLPAAIEFRKDTPLGKVTEYNKYRRTLVFEGVMTTAQRDELLALNDDIDYQVAVRRLYSRSQFRAAEPLPALPAGVTLADTPVRFDPQRGLVAKAPFGKHEYDALHDASTDPAYRAALERLYSRSRIEASEPVWVGVPLEGLPSKFARPDRFKRELNYSAADKTLLWRGEMSEETRDALIAISEDAAWVAAVKNLFTAAAARSFPTPLPEAAHGIVTYDAASRRLTAVGPIDEMLASSLRGDGKDVALATTVKQLASKSAPARATENYRDLVQWTLWGGTACMVTSGLLMFLLQWRSALRAFAGLGQMFGGKKNSSNPVDAIETPMSWFLFGQLFSLLGLIYLGHITFGMPWWETTVAVLLSFALALVACRVTGETDTTPVGAMGKITQLTFGAISPGNMQVNLMAANITAGAAGSSADLLTDLKSGYLLGAHPRKQFIAQFCGIFTGTLVTVLAFRLLVPNADVLGGDQFPAPAAQTWKGVAEAMAIGLANLHPLKFWSIIIGGGVGIILPLLSIALPRYKNWIPSAAGIGLAWTFHWYTAFSFFLGSLIGWAWEKRSKSSSEEYMFPVMSGVIAGGSLMGVFLVFWENGAELFGKLFGF